MRYAQASHIPHNDGVLTSSLRIDITLRSAWPQACTPGSHTLHRMQEQRGILHGEKRRFSYHGIRYRASSWHCLTCCAATIDVTVLPPSSLISCFSTLFFNFAHLTCFTHSPSSPPPPHSSLFPVCCSYAVDKPSPSSAHNTL